MTITSTTVSSGDTSNDATINLTFTSNESTTNFTESDITLVNGSLSNFTGSNKIYTATFTPTADGTCTISVDANKFTDEAGNNNSVSNSFTWTFDSTDPSIISITPSWGSHLNATDDNSSGTVTVITNNVDEGQTLTITLNEINYTGSITSNSCLLYTSPSPRDH